MEDEIVRKRSVADVSPDAHMKKALGKNFEFSEKYLTANIDPQLIIRALKKRYRFKRVTRETLKHILYEGARLNKVLRINDSCFDKMVDVLNIPVEEEAENDKSVSDNSSQPR